MKYLKRYDRFLEDGGDGGASSGSATVGATTAGMGAVTSSQPGAFAGTTGTTGSGDVGYTLGVYTKGEQRKKRKKGTPSEVSDLRDLKKADIEKKFESLLETLITENNYYDETPKTFEWDLRKKDESPITFEWDFKNNNSTFNKFKNLLSKVPKINIKDYFIKFIDKIKNLPEYNRKKTLINYGAIFLSMVSLNSLIENIENDPKVDQNIKKIAKEFKEVNKKSTFEIAQEIVSNVEKGYSDDRKDIGNYVEFELNGKKVKRFIGTKYGISAPVLMNYLGKLPKKEDMINLSYSDALNILRSKYWENLNLSEFNNQSISNIIYDGCVNQGIGAMRGILRNILRNNGVQITDEESPFKKEYIMHLNCMNMEKLFNDIKSLREEKYKSAKTFDEHGNGWLNRISDFKFEK